MVLAFAGVAINLATGASLDPDAALPGFAGWVVQVVTVLVLIGLGEEPAWRGYALPRLLAGRSALAAALLLGLWHALWHLPLFGVEYDLANGLPWAITVCCFAVVTTWMWLHTDGNLLLPVLLHTAVNSVAFVWRWFAGPDQLRLWWIAAALWTAVVIVIVVVHGPRLVRHHIGAAA